VVAGVLEFGLHGYTAARIATKVMEQYLKTSLVNASATTNRSSAEAGAHDEPRLGGRLPPDIDYPLLLTALLLSALGLAMVYSAGQTDMPQRRPVGGRVAASARCGSSWRSGARS
jgi:hypothetical protein